MGEQKKKSSAAESDGLTPAEGMTSEKVQGSVHLVGLRLHKKIAVTIAAVLLVGVAGFLSVYLHNKNKPAPMSNVCSDAITREANAQNKNGSVTGLNQVVQQVKANNSYVNDPNCLYIVTEYQIISDDLNGAQSTLDQLNKRFANYQFSKNLDDGKASLKSLQDQYNLAKQAQRNSDGGIDPAI